MIKRLYRTKFSGHTYIIEADNANQIKAWVHEQIELRIGNPSAQHMRKYLEDGKDVITLPVTDYCDHDKSASVDKNVGFEGRGE